MKRERVNEEPKVTLVSISGAGANINALGSDGKIYFSDDQGRSFICRGIPLLKVEVWKESFKCCGVIVAQKIEIVMNFPGTLKIEEVKSAYPV